MELTKTKRKSLTIESAMTKVYGWMILGLLMSTFTGFVVANNPELFERVQKHVALIIIAKLVMVFFMSKVARDLGNFAAGVLFLAYAASTGAFLALLTASFTSASIVSALVTAVGLFGIMTLYGFVTKKNLETVGQYCLIGLFGLLFAIVVNLFLGSSAIEIGISVIAILIFLGLTAFETQEIKSNPYYRHYPVLGALSLYLNLINLFIHILSLLGNNDD